MANPDNTRELELYKKMYYHLFNKITDALESHTIAEQNLVLKQAQMETEEMYISF